MNLTRSDELMPVLQAALPAIRERLLALLPHAEFHHIGATALPGAITKGDVDVLLRVAQPDFPFAVERLRAQFLVKQVANWSASFASFGDDASYSFPLGVQLVVKDSEYDFFLFIHDHLKSNPGHLAEYNRIKTDSASSGPEEYWKAKNVFLSNLLTLRKTGG